MRPLFLTCLTALLCLAACAQGPAGGPAPLAAARPVADAPADPDRLALRAWPSSGPARAMILRCTASATPAISPSTAPPTTGPRHRRLRPRPARLRRGRLRKRGRASTCSRRRGRHRRRCRRRNPGRRRVWRPLDGGGVALAAAADGMDADALCSPAGPSPAATPEPLARSARLDPRLRPARRPLDRPGIVEIIRPTIPRGRPLPTRATSATPPAASSTASSG